MFRDKAALKLLRSLPALLVLAGSAASASGLQVAPVTLTIPATRSADGLWLSNTSTDALHAQVRVYHWTQEGGEDKLTPSRGLVISPPMLEIQPSGNQLVRVIRLAAPPSGKGAAEDAYRVIIDELPIDAKEKKGLQFVLRYSVPIFIEPAGEAPSAPKLEWSVKQQGDKATLEASNNGGTHAQVANLGFIDAKGRRIEISQGLLGYVLPGAKMQWVVKLPARLMVSAGKWEATINGTKAIQNIPLVTDSR